jgi:general secretion pathway protein G
MNKTSSRSRAAGFTLIEIMVVVVILGILAAFVVPKLMDAPGKARVVAAKHDIAQIRSALDLYKLDNFNYPSTQQGLMALVAPPQGEPAARNWKPGGYLEKAPTDPWGHPYQYLNPGLHSEIDIFTLGSDNAPGGEGEAADIGNWGDN